MRSLRPGIWVRYTLARLALFLLAWLVVWAIGWTWLARDQLTVLWTAVVALALSAVASLLLLRGLRAELAEQVQGRARRLSASFERSRRTEDDAGEQ